MLRVNFFKKFLILLLSLRILIIRHKNVEYFAAYLRKSKLKSDKREKFCVKEKMSHASCRMNLICMPSINIILGDARRFRFVAGWWGKKRLSPPFVGREHESCGRSLEKLSQLYSQAPYTFQLLSDRAAFQFCTQTNLIVCHLVLEVFLFPVPLRDLADGWERRASSLRVSSAQWTRTRPKIDLSRKRLQSFQISRCFAMSLQSVANWH